MKTVETVEEINLLLSEIADQEAELLAIAYINQLELEEFERLSAEHDMQMYASHSYDQDAIHYGAQYA
jgi:hypothetical protein